MCCLVFWDPGRRVYWGFQVKCVSWYQELTLRIGDRLKGAVCSSRIFLVPWEWGQSERLKRVVICYRPGDKTGNWRNGGRWEDLWLGYLFSWLDWSTVSQGVPAG